MFVYLAQTSLFSRISRISVPQSGGGCNPFVLDRGHGSCDSDDFTNRKVGLFNRLSSLVKVQLDNCTSVLSCQHSVRN